MFLLLVRKTNRPINIYYPISRKTAILEADFDGTEIFRPQEEITLPTKVA